MVEYYKTPILVAKTSKGLNKYWQGFAVTNTIEFAIQSHFWQDKADGTPSSKLVSTPKIVSGKNIGKSNEILPRDQARIEIKAKAELKKKKGYHIKGSSELQLDRLPLPMLAHTYEKRSHDIDWDNGVYVQPKLDGVRMLFDGKKGWSRQGNLFDQEVIAHLLCDLPPGVILDGELMLPPPATFQDSIRAIKKYRPGVSQNLRYHIYDMVIQKPSATFMKRTQGVAHIFYDKKWNLLDNPGFDLVQTIPIRDEENDIANWHEVFTKDGYEGIMIRNAKGVYKIGHRSKDLQKLKHFKDNEFEITMVLSGSGSEQDCAIFQCQTPKGNSFTVRPRGTIEQRKKWFKRGKDLVGEKLTVRYQELTEDGIPRFPVGIALRNYEAQITIKT